MPRQCGDASCESAPMLLVPRRTCGTARTGNEVRYVAGRHAELLGGAGEFLSALAQLHGEPQSSSGAADRLLIHHAVGRTPQLIRSVHRCDARRDRRKRWLADRECHNRRHWRELANEPLEHPDAARRHRLLDARDEVLGLIFSHRHRVVLVRLRGQSRIDECHPPALDYCRHTPERCHAHQVSPPGVFSHAHDARCAPHHSTHRVIYSSSGGAPPILATSSCFTRSTLKRVAAAIVLSITSSKSNSVALENRIGFTRAMTNGLRYGLVRPRSLSAATTLDTASSSFSNFVARRSRSRTAFGSESSRKSSMRRSSELYAPPLK